LYKNFEIIKHSHKFTEKYPMKKSALLVAALIALSFSSCDLIDSLTDKDSVDGDQSTMGQVGAEVSAFDIPGVEGAKATVVNLDGGISSFTGEAKITDPALLNLISNVPGFTVNGDKISVTGLEFQVTKEGIASKVPEYPGTLVKYDSKVGDKYKVTGGVEREVISKSTDDDYPYGYMYIKVMKVEESPSLIPGVSKIVYIANHKFGIVGLEVTLDDNTTKSFSIWGSTEN
jgi:hypothetical protein